MTSKAAPIVTALARQVKNFTSCTVCQIGSPPLNGPYPAAELIWGGGTQDLSRHGQIDRTKSFLVLVHASNHDQAEQAVEELQQLWLGTDWLPVVALSQVAKTFSVAGDCRDEYPAGALFWLRNSTGNDAQYTTAAGGASYNSTTDRTTIPVTAALPSAVADGEIELYLGNTLATLGVVGVPQPFADDPPILRPGGLSRLRVDVGFNIEIRYAVRT